MIRRKKHHAVIVLGALSLATIAGGPAAQQRERYSLAGDRVAIDNLAGELRVEPGTGSAVVVEVVRGGKDAGALKVNHSTRKGIPTLTVAYPGNRIVYPGLEGRWNSTIVHDGHSREIGALLEGSARTVTVSGSGSGTHAWADLRVLIPPGKKVIVHHVAGHATAANVSGDLELEHGVGPLEVEGHRGNLALDTGSGRVEVKDCQGDVRLDSGSGAVSLTGVRGGDLLVDSGSGSVRVSGARVRDLRADTGSGRISLRGISAERVLLDTGSGGVDLELTGDVEELVVDTGSGGVTVRVPPSLGAEFFIETSSGGIEVGVDHDAIHSERRERRGRIGDGRGQIRIETGSGGVRILPSGGSSSSGRIGLMGGLRADWLS